MLILEESCNLRVKILLSLVFGLRGEVSPALRAAGIKWDEKTVHLFFYYDGEVSEEDQESAECVATEVIANFSSHELNVDIIRCDYPNSIPNEGEIVYHRREP